MSLIFCNDNCKYQKNGYCEYKHLDNTQNFTNSSAKCAYFCKKTPHQEKPNEEK